MCPCQEIPGIVKVMNTLMPSQTRIVRTSPPTLSATTIRAPISPKIAPDAPSVAAWGSASQ
jgi:hypothetical protein